MLYDRKIKYLDYIVGGERLQAAGFVKVEVRDEVCRMQIHVNGLHLSDSFERKVILRNADRESFVKMIKIADGKGDTGEIVLNTSSMGSGNISYGGLEQIVIPIDNDREIRCIWNTKINRKNETGNETEGYREAGNKKTYRHEEGDKKAEYRKEEDEKAEYRETGNEKAEYREIGDEIAKYSEADSVKAENEEADSGKSENERFRDEETACETDTYMSDEYVAEETDRDESVPKDTEYKADDCNKREDMHSAQITPDEIAQPGSMAPYPQDDKWKQVSALYEHGNVFGEMSDCILIRPGDFVILPDKYYKLVNNSFLLHGYHNYGYLVLARTEKRGEIKYYIGVPGNFFEKEKQVAIMFGFESFECGKSYVQPGDFGYYMIRVEL